MGTVEIVRDEPLVTTGATGVSFAKAHLLNVESSELLRGETVVVDGILVDNAYSALFVCVLRVWSGTCVSLRREPPAGVVERLPMGSMTVSWPNHPLSWPSHPLPSARAAIADIARHSGFRISVVEPTSEPHRWSQSINLPHVVGDLRICLDLLLTEVNRTWGRRFVWRMTADREITISEEVEQPDPQ
ncbi:MAG: hypothetical protein H0W72_04475 [Planctomycetes bacterium]|nr:hypothetical protein [Planctomycetota bacterium]